MYVDSHALRAALRTVKVAVAKDNNRYGLNGILLEAVPNGIRLVATDGARLHWVEVPGQGHFAQPYNRLLPLGAAKAFIANLTPKGGVEVSADENTLTVGDVTLDLIKGEFPDYRQCIPAQGKRTVRIDFAEFIDAINDVKDDAVGKEHCISVTFDTEATVKAGTKAKATVACQLDGSKLRVGFNWKLLLDGLKAAGEGLLELGNSLDPVVIRGPGRCVVVMPLRLG